MEDDENVKFVEAALLASHFAQFVNLCMQGDFPDVQNTQRFSLGVVLKQLPRSE